MSSRTDERALPTEKKLFWREELRPHRAPFCGGLAKAIRRDLVAFGVGSGPDPALRAPHEHVRGRHQPLGVIERSGSKAHRGGASLALATHPCPAVGATPR